MKKFLYMLLSIALLLVVITFTIQNPDEVEIQYYFGFSWQGPLSIVIVMSLVIGILVGVMGGFAKNLQLRMKYSRLIKGQHRAPGNKTAVPAAGAPKSLP